MTVVNKHKPKEKYLETVFKLMEKYKIEEYNDEQNGIKITRQSLKLEEHELEKEKEYSSKGFSK